jgi:hypothetical protein
LTAKWTVKWTVNRSGKPRLRRSRLLSTLLSIPRQIQHITLDVHPVEREARLGGGVGVDQGKLVSRMFMPSTFARARSFPRTASPSVPPTRITVPTAGFFPKVPSGAKNMDFCGGLTGKIPSISLGQPRTDSQSAGRRFDPGGWLQNKSAKNMHLASMPCVRSDSSAAQMCANSVPNSGNLPEPTCTQAQSDKFLLHVRAIHSSLLGSAFR